MDDGGHEGTEGFAISLITAESFPRAGGIQTGLAARSCPPLPGM